MLEDQRSFPRLWADRLRRFRAQPPICLRNPVLYPAELRGHWIAL